MKFKIGDRVRFLIGYRRDLKIVGQIVNINKKVYYPLDIKYPDYDGKLEYSIFKEDEVELLCDPNLLLKEIL